MAEKIKIKMTETKVGTENGFTDIVFEKGGVYNIGESLYKSFRNMGSCERVLNSENLETKVESPVVSAKIKKVK
jgi:hypothetical protein